MLIRIADHFRNNPKRVDKLIAIKGLPKEWIFHEGPEGMELKKPWMPDIDANIPHDIRHLCEKVEITLRYPPIERGQKEVLERRPIIGIKIDYNSQPGREMWDQVERYLEESMPRNERIPIPVVCAKDERSAFETYMPRRTATNSLEFVPAPIPEVDLSKYVQVVVQTIEPPVAPPQTPLATPVQATVQEPSKKPQAALFKCEECDYEHSSKQGIRMHRVKRHPKKEKVGTP